MSVRPDAQPAAGAVLPAAPHPAP
ncbi:MAG: hypothetical protein V7603_5638, partial [Micromonosporaceae bacterium]